MSYAQDTEYAAKSLIDLAMCEEREIEELWPNLQDAESRVKALQRNFKTSSLHEEFSDHYVNAAFHRMAVAKEELDPLRLKVDELRSSMGAKQHAMRIICGTILQLAKQGVSLVHGRKSNAPQGRTIAGRPIRDIIWEARNQAMHCDEGKYRSSVIDLFSDLEKAFGPKFSLSAHAQVSCAAEIVKVLGWDKYEQYERDLRSLGL